MAISKYYLVPPLPEGLEGLSELGLDLRWSWSHESDPVWERIDPDIWKSTRNPWMILQSVALERMEMLAEEDAFRQEVQKHVEGHQKYLKRPTWFSRAHPKLSFTTAYFSMEFGLTEALPLYSGGLGILAGDVLKTASDLGVPLVGIGLLYQQGYFRQVINAEGSQVEYYPHKDPSQLPLLPVRDSKGEWLRIEIQFPGRLLKLRVWEGQVGRVKLYLLDSNDPENSPADQCITSELYGGGQELRLKQEMVLGIGGWHLLESLGIEAEVCHLNEGHAALAVVERARSFMRRMNTSFEVALTATRAGNIFTTHTPVEAGFDRFPPALAWQYLGRYAEQNGIGFDKLMGLGRQNPGDTSEPLNMAYLAVRGSGIVTGVSRLHGQVSRHIFEGLFPHWPKEEIPITYVTNGVHMPSWDSADADTLWTDACGKDRWLGTERSIEADFKQVPDDILWPFRNEGCRHLVEYARERLAGQLEASGMPEEKVSQVSGFLDPNALTIGFARRFTSYKRPNLLLHDEDRLTAMLLNKERPVQLIIAGKAHPQDEKGKALVHAWLDYVRRPEIRPHAVFLADYDMSLAERMVQGVDLWINNPRRPMEACGTSGMKVLVNGGLNLSELDGWWAEAYKPEVGWSLGDGREHGEDPEWDAREAEQLYRILEQEVIPSFYDRDSNGIPKKWVERMRTSMAELTPRFSSDRMLREYVDKLYLPALEGFRERSRDGAAKSVELCQWKESLQSHWSEVHFGNVECREEKNDYEYEAQVYTNGIDPDEIAVQLYADPLEGQAPEIYTMSQGSSIDKPEKGYVYKVQLPARRKKSDYTPRVVAALHGTAAPMEADQILWKT